MVEKLNAYKSLIAQAESHQITSGSRAVTHELMSNQEARFDPTERYTKAEDRKIVYSIRRIVGGERLLRSAERHQQKADSLFDQVDEIAVQETAAYIDLYEANETEIRSTPLGKAEREALQYELDNFADEMQSREEIQRGLFLKTQQYEEENPQIGVSLTPGGITQLAVAMRKIDNLVIRKGVDKLRVRFTPSGRQTISRILEARHELLEVTTKEEQAIQAGNLAEKIAQLATDSDWQEQIDTLEAQPHHTSRQ